MYVSDFPIMSDPEVRHMRFDRLVSLMSTFGYTFTRSMFDCGDTVRVKGPGIRAYINDNATSECGDDWTSAGLMFAILDREGLVPEVVFESIVTPEY